MLVSFVVLSLAVLEGPAPQPARAALTKAIEACHFVYTNELDEQAFLRGAGFTRVQATGGGWTWQWHEGGYKLAVSDGMFGCAVTLEQGSMSDAEAARVVDGWAASKGYQRPRSGVVGELIVQRVMRRAEGWELSAYRNDAGRLVVNLTPGLPPDA